MDSLNTDFLKEYLNQEYIFAVDNRYTASLMASGLVIAGLPTILGVNWVLVRYWFSFARFEVAA